MQSWLSSQFESDIALYKHQIVTNTLCWKIEYCGTNHLHSDLNEIDVKAHEASNEFWYSQKARGFGKSMK